VAPEPKVHHRVHKRPPSIPILSQLNPLHAPQQNSLRSILIPSSHLPLGLPRGHFPSLFSTNTLYNLFSSPIRVTCPAHIVLLDLICLMIFGNEYNWWISSLCNFFHSPATSSHVRDQVSRPYKTTSRILVLYTLTFIFLDTGGKTKDWTKW
jgi:hypothetical protein